MSEYLEVKTLAHGQPRPYADSDYIMEFIFTRDDSRLTEFLKKNNLPKIVPRYIPGDIALMIARAYCPYVDKGSEEDNWAQRHLVSFDRLEPTPHQMTSPGWSGTLTVNPKTSDRWRIHVRAAFTD